MKQQRFRNGGGMITQASPEVKVPYTRRTCIVSHKFHQGAEGHGCFSNSARIFAIHIINTTSNRDFEELANAYIYR